ncbi:MAG: hypothetical protein HY684_00940 [Chloroflexi bacterium]|nr:hypothetical protein [Chloroflexota bacterium]
MSGKNVPGKDMERAEVKAGLVAFSIAAVLWGWATLASNGRQDTEAAPAPDTSLPPNAETTRAASEIEMPPIPTVVAPAALLAGASQASRARPAVELPPIPTIVPRTALLATASTASGARPAAGPPPIPVVAVPTLSAAPALAPLTLPPIADLPPLPAMVSAPPSQPIMTVPAPRAPAVVRTRSSR